MMDGTAAAMTAPKWTGPIEDWRIDWSTYGGPYIRYPSWPHPENGHSIAKLTFAAPTPFEEKRKRASLIVAAPRLAASLRELVDAAGNPSPEALARAAAALADAESQP